MRGGGRLRMVCCALFQRLLLVSEGQPSQPVVLACSGHNNVLLQEVKNLSDGERFSCERMDTLPLVLGASKVCVFDFLDTAESQPHSPLAPAPICQRQGASVRPYHRTNSES